MNRRTALALCCVGLLAVPAFAAEEPRPRSCCAKKDAKAAAEKTGKYRCSLTGREVDKCCCETRDGGRMYCTLAKKDIGKCCCTELKAAGKDAK